MAWVPYRAWAGAVSNARIRVPLTSRMGITVYGPSMTPMSLSPGAIGMVRNVLTGARAKPSYVKFPGQLNLNYALEIEVTRALNSATVWAGFSNAHMNGDKAMVVVLRYIADALEIDDQKR